MYVLLKFDGAVVGNVAKDSPRAAQVQAAYGFVVTSPTGTLIHEEGRRCRATTSNEAELAGLLAGLTWIQANGYRRVRIQGDSTLVLRTLDGTFRISQKPHLARLFFQISQRLACRSVETDEPTRRRLQLDPVSTDDRLVVEQVRKIGRKQNARADQLAGQQIGSRETRTPRRVPPEAS